MQLEFAPEFSDLLWLRPPGLIVELDINRKVSLKDLVEAQGVPHTEVAAVCREDGSRIPWNYHPKNCDVLRVAPFTQSLDPLVGDFYRQPLEEIKFLVDICVAPLAKHLRLLGFDCFFETHIEDPEIARRAAAEGWIVLTRDRGLLFRKCIEWGQLLRSDQPEEQASEVIHRYDLASHIKLFTRCLKCSGTLEEVKKSEILHELEPLTKEHYHDFSRCSVCAKIYWQGSHYTKLAEKVGRSFSGNLG